MTDASLPPPPTLRATCEQNLHRSVLSGVTLERQAPLRSRKELSRPLPSLPPFTFRPGRLDQRVLRRSAGPGKFAPSSAPRTRSAAAPRPYTEGSEGRPQRLPGPGGAGPRLGKRWSPAAPPRLPAAPRRAGSNLTAAEAPRPKESGEQERGKPAEEPRAKALPPASPYSLLPSWSPAPGAQPLPGRAGTLRGQRGRDAPQPANPRRGAAAAGPFVRLRDGPLPPASLPAARPTYRPPCPAPSSRAPGAAAAAPAGWGAPGRLRAGLRSSGGRRCPGTSARSGQRGGPARLGGQLRCGAGGARCGARCGAPRPGSVLPQPALSEIAAVRSQTAARNLSPLRCCGRESFPGF